MDKCFNKDVCMILKSAEKEMLNLRHPYVGTEHLLLALLKRKDISDFCGRFKLTYTGFREALINVIGCASKKSEFILYTPLLKKVIDDAQSRANGDNKSLDDLYLFSSLFDENDGIALRIVSSMGIDPKELTKELGKPKILSSLGICLNDTVSDRIYLRDKEIDEIISVLLRKNKNNPLLVGKAGTGKSAIVYELARRINEGAVPDALKNMKIYLISTSSLVAGTKYRGEFEEKINNLINEVIKCKNIILFIDEIHTIVKTGSSEAGIDAANILKPYLARDDLKVIGATTTSEYNEYLKKDSAFLRRFAKIMINEPTNADMIKIMNKVKLVYEDYYNLKISKKVILSLVKYCDQYLPNSSNPDKCIDILDTTCSNLILDKYKSKKSVLEVRDSDIYDTILSRVNVVKSDYERIDALRDELCKSYNEKIVSNILNLLRDVKANRYMVMDGADNKEKKSILERISKFLNINLMFFDCKDYSDEYGLNKFIGNNYLYNEVCDNPSSLIVFDNYNQRNRVLDNVIGTMINKGYIESSKNEKVFLNNSVVFLFNNDSSVNLGFGV